MVGVTLFHRHSLAIIILSEMSVSKRSATVNRNFSPMLRVIEGYSDVGNYPYVVTIETKEKLLPIVLRGCTGSLITSQFVLTAAHCLSPNMAFVRCGNMTLPVNESTCLSKILNGYPHPSFINAEPRKFENDIALLQVEKLAMSSYGRLNFADYKTLIGRAVKYAGFGLVVYPKHLTLEKLLLSQILPLQIGEGVIFKDDEKLNTWPQLLIASKCSKKKQHMFSGDSGGPLLVDNKIAGVATAIDEKLLKGVKRHPPYFTCTPISPYLDWIKHILEISDENKSTFLRIP